MPFSQEHQVTIKARKVRRPISWLSLQYLAPKDGLSLIQKQSVELDFLLLWKKNSHDYLHINNYVILINWIGLLWKGDEKEYIFMLFIWGYFK